MTEVNEMNKNEIVENNEHLRKDINRCRRDLADCQGMVKIRGDIVRESRKEIDLLGHSIKAAADHVSCLNKVIASYVNDMAILEAKLWEERNKNRSEMDSLKKDSLLLKEVVGIMRWSDEFHDWQAMNRLADLLVDYIDVED